VESRINLIENASVNGTECSKKNKVVFNAGVVREGKLEGIVLISLSFWLMS
jgi:hypothetical protein